MTWLPYEFRYKPGDLRRPPAWVAPHQPRLDWQMWFAALVQPRCADASRGRRRRRAEAGAELVEATDVGIDTGSRSVAIGRLAVLAPRLRIERDAVRHWAHERWTTPPGTATPAADGGAPWKVSLAELAVERGRVGIVDRAGAVPVGLDVLDLALQLRGFELAARSVPVRVSARVSVPAGPSGKAVGSGVVGRVDVQGELLGIVAGVPSGGRATLLLKDLPMHLLDPYLDDLLDIDVQKAQTSFKGELRWSRAAAGMSVALHGDATVDDFRASNAATDRRRRGAGWRWCARGAGAPAGQLEVALVARPRPGARPRSCAALQRRGDRVERLLRARCARRERTSQSRRHDASDQRRGQCRACCIRAACRGSAAASAPAVSSSAAPAATPPAIVSFGPIVVVGGRVQYNDRSSGRTTTPT